MKQEEILISEYTLLGFLAGGSCHGYDLHKRMTDDLGIGMIWGVKISNMYAQLEKLAARGLISGQLQAKDQRPARLEYSLTAEGKNEFTRWLHQPVEHPRNFRYEFMARVYFYMLYEPSQLNDLVDRQLDFCRQWLTNTLEKEKALSHPGNFEHLIFHFRTSQIQSIIEWLQWFKTQIPNILTERESK